MGANAGVEEASGSLASRSGLRRAATGIAVAQKQVCVVGHSEPLP